MDLEEPKNYEPEIWQNMRKNIGWVMYDSLPKILYRINIFDDGNESLKQLDNLWYIYGSYKGKVAIVNAVDSKSLVFSISMWKLEKV